MTNQTTQKGAPSSSSRRTSTAIENYSTTVNAGVDSDDMDVDTQGSPVKTERPKIQRSELSEILENVNNGMAGMEGVMGQPPSGMVHMSSASPDALMSTGLPVVGAGDADGDGESPGLDALAMAAGAVV